MEKASWRVSRWKDSFRRLGSSDTSSSCPRHSPPQERDYPDADPRGGLMTELPDRATAYPMTASTAARCTCNDKRNARKYRFKLIGGLLLPYFLASLDLTVVSTALPFIASDFNRFDQLNWIVTAYTLTSTAFIPAFGQLADVFGRYISLQGALFFTVLGSVLCAAAQSWAVLLLGRALQGLSAAGLTSIILIVLADKVSLKENARNNTLFMIVSGSTYAIGPVLGGYLTDANWRYVFVISIPIAVVSHILIFFTLRGELVEGTHFHKGSSWSSIFPALATLDLGGMVLFLFGVGLIILGTSWGESTYAWDSTQVLVTVIVGGLLSGIFVLYEYLLEDGRLLGRLLPRQSPMIPMSLFSRKDTFVVAVIQFSAGAAMYAVFYFVGIYFTLVEGYPASQAGTQLLYYIPGIAAGVYMAMFMCNRFPGQTFWPLLFGTIEEAAGLAALTWAVAAGQPSVVTGVMVLAGAGTGSRFMPASLHIAGVWPERLAPAMSLMRFATPFGGTLALTIMGAVFNTKFASATASMSSSLGVDGSSASINLQDSQFLDAINNLPSAVQAAVRDAARSGVKWAFISILPILGISVLFSFALGNVWVRPSANNSQDAGPNGTSLRAHLAQGHDSEERTWSGLEAAEGARQDDAVVDVRGTPVVYVPYLWALVKGVDRYKHISRPLEGQEKRADVYAPQEQPVFYDRA